MTTTRQRALVAFGLLVSGVFLFLAVRGLHPGAFLESLAQANAPLVLACAALYLVALAIIAWRWQFLLNPLGRVPLWGVVRLVFIGYMGNNVYPLRAGEVLRIVLLKRHHNIPMLRTTTTVLVERVFDGIVLLTFVLVGVSALPQQNEVIRAVLNVAAPVFVVGLLGFFAVALQPDLARRLLESALAVRVSPQHEVTLSGAPHVLARLLPAPLRLLVARLADGLLAGLAGLRSPAALAGAVFASYASWAFAAWVFWVMMDAFALPAPFTGALLAVGVVNLAGLIPASPGQIGVFEYFGTEVMVALGAPRDLALAYTLVVHVIVWLPVTLWGFGLLVREGLGWRALANARALEGA